MAMRSSRSPGQWKSLLLVAAVAVTLVGCDLFDGKHTYADLDFSDKGNAAPALTKGFSGQEPSGRWTEGPLAEITVRLDKVPTKDISLVANLAPLSAPGHSQNVDISVNGKLVGHWTLSVAGFQDQIVSIPNGTITSIDPIRVSFSLPNAATPESLKINSDKRVLGIFIKRIQFADA